ncbi:hypothetical protein [Spirosoma panaciterrae]|uniref:hypothetical protein n=1 Tax=Spirosoma panaciterrae TaxID=496058 RepID=UPI00036B9E5E|nr:hypothetical protein [Spirosoma panaciterrae]
MKIIRQYAFPHDQVIQVKVPKEFDEQQVEIQVILVEDPDHPKNVKNGTGLGHLVGKYKHYTQQQNEAIDQEIRDFERFIGKT